MIADSEPPDITCPLLNPYNNTANKNYAIINLPLANATDNSGLQPIITMSKASPLKVYVKKNVQVVYTATDEDETPNLVVPMSKLKVCFSNGIK